MGFIRGTDVLIDKTLLIVLIDAGRRGHQSRRHDLGGLIAASVYHCFVHVRQVSTVH